MAYNRITDYFPNVSASTDLSTCQFHAVYLNSGCSVMPHLGNASTPVIGVLQNEPADAEQAQVAYKIGDIFKWECDGSTTCAIVYGYPLWPDARGKGIKVITGGCPYCARAMESTTGGSSVIAVMWHAPDVVVTASLYS